MIAAFAAVTRDLPQPMLLLDGAGALLGANRAAQAALGALPAGSSFAERVVDPAAFAEWLRLCQRSDGALPVGFALRDGGGERRHRGGGHGVRRGEARYVVLQLAVRSERDEFVLLSDKIEQLVAEILRRKQIEAQLAREAARLRRLQAITAALAGAATVENVAVILVEQVSAILRAPLGVVYTADGAALRLLASRGLEPAAAAGLDTLALARPGPLPEAVRRGRALWIDDAAAAPHPAAGDGAPVPWRGRPMLALPLGTPDRTLGAAGFALAGGDRPSEEDRVLVETIGQLCAQAFDRARLFEAERDARHEAERLAEAARAAYERASEADRRKDEFLAVLGHELRNPLAPILTALELMRLRGPDETFAGERGAIERQVRHLLRLVDDLLDVSRIARGSLELRRERIEVAAAVARAIDLASPLLEKHGHEVTLLVPRAGLAVDADPVRLAQAIGNVIINAAKYTPSGGQITIAARRDERDVLVSVRDNGEGIAPEMLSRIFDMFVQAPQAIDRAEGGLGIGLTLVRSIVEKHGGTVRAHSDGPGRGTELTLRLPAAEVTAASQRAPSRAGAERAGAAPRRVLIVDDNLDAAELLEQLLQSHGHETRVASDGPTALAAAAELHPDVVLLDIGLPVMDGFEVARLLRATAGLEQTAIIALTGYGQPSDRKRSAAAGFDDHLTKPITVERVLAAIARARRPASSMAQ